MEIVVVDGGSTPSFARELQTEFPGVRVISERDRGIYDAMNRGIAETTGLKVWFLNGGDLCEIQSWKALRHDVLTNPRSMVFHRYQITLPDGTSQRRLPKPVGYLRHALPTSHQAILYPGLALREHRYDLSFDVAGDYELTARMWAGGVPATRGNLLLATFTPGGTSTVRIKEVAIQANRVHAQVLGSGRFLRALSRSAFAISRVRWRSYTTGPSQEGGVSESSSRVLESMPVRDFENPWRDFARDKQGYGTMPWLMQPALYSVATYRLGRWTLTAPLPIRPVVHAFYFALYSMVRLATGIDIPRSARIGPGFTIHHFGGIIISPHAKVGSDFTIRHGVTVGSAKDDDRVPVIGDRVVVGAHALILGDIVVGNDVTIGAATLVLADCPDDCVVVGVPGRVVGR
ncbi:hypothetical protein BH10ACT10_BH10ACT10_01730 [soil metagenome]